MGFSEWEFTLLDREWARLDDLRRYRENQERAWARGTGTITNVSNSSGGSHGHQDRSQDTEESQG